MTFSFIWQFNVLFNKLYVRSLFGFRGFFVILWAKYSNSENTNQKINL